MNLINRLVFPAFFTSRNGIDPIKKTMEPINSQGYVIFMTNGLTSMRPARITNSKPSRAYAL